ncbi:MAG: succinylglutamate desuccinylase/aspartoacylase family protein [Rhodobacterales bacterium]|nr:succinylglutamate desuccinylase/aspartoacylase family protein [Rhodobacterales bacterium]
MTPEIVLLAGDAPGTQRQLICLRFGVAGARPKVYLQAGLHADEMPGVLALQHLLPLLDAAEAEGKIPGEVLVVPAANPIGLSQWAFQRPLGRMEAESLHNFNRGYPDLATRAGDLVDGLLGDDPAANAGLIRAALVQAVAEVRAQARTDMVEGQLTLLAWSIDADHVLDLHCDHQAVMHLYASPARPADTSLLCRCTGARVALIQDVSGGNAFDEAHTVPWLQLRQRFGDQVPAGCFSSTLEYRGQFDVSDALAAGDAAGLMAFLVGVGAVIGDATPLHPDAPHLPLGGAGEVFAPQGGVVTWDSAPGETVTQGQVLGHVTDPMTRVRQPIRATNTGLLFRLELWRSCLRGQSLAHVAGETVLRNGDLLSD